MLKPKELKLPVKFDDYGGYFWDAEGRMIMNMRGWGWIQKLENAEEIQDSIGKYIEHCINCHNQSNQ